MLTVQWLLGLLLALTTAVRCTTPPQIPQQPLLLAEKNLSDDQLLTLHRDLVEIESITGNEHEVAKYLQSYLSKHNFTVEAQEVASTGEQKSRFTYSPILGTSAVPASSSPPISTPSLLSGPTKSEGMRYGAEAALTLRLA
jgi:hypothetical protein